MVSVSNHERVWRVALAFAVVFLAFHLPYFPQSLEDLDSVNFALGVRDYDVGQHQPHPPGYPFYILIAKGLRVFTGSELSALSLLSMLAGAIGIVAMAALARRVIGAEPSLWAVLMAMTSPLYWFTAARPLSDMAGLAAAMGVQVLTLASTSARQLYFAAFCAALATGLRSQVAWLTLPLIGAQAFLTDEATSRRIAALAGALLAFAIGVLAWFIPLVMITGGPRAYWAVLSFQGSADVANIQILLTHHSPRDIVNALYYAFIAPWATWPIAVVVLLLATLGFATLAWRSFRTLVTIAAAFGPYYVFDLLFQETFTSRYALPLVIPVAFLAGTGAMLLPWRSGAIVAIAVAMASAHAGGTSVAAFAREKTPAFRLLDDMRGAAAAAKELPVLAMDRKQSFDFRRPMIWVDGALPQFARSLPAPPQHEWLEAVKYWSEGGRAPVWFVVDPKRTMIHLVQHGDPARYRWALPHPVLIGGARPDEMDFYRVEAPDWFVGEGWALTPEAAGIADADDRGPSVSPIAVWVSRRVAGGALVIGGRNFSPTPATIMIGAPGAIQPLFPSFTTPPGAFFHIFPLPTFDLPPAQDYVRLPIRASTEARVAIEQFDASGSRPIFAYGAGWFEQEFNPRTGARWRWLSERGELRFASRTPRLTLHLEGENPKTYFSRGSRLLVRAADRVIFDDVLTADFALDLPVPDGIEVVTFETDQVFQPADRSRRSQDRRHLGLRIFKVEVRSVS
jgi:Dolichyl-phosphate-mannose-protein mannosyltransferase